MKRTQTGWIFIILLPVIQITLTIAFWRAYQGTLNELPKEIKTGWYISLFIVVALLLLFYKLTVEVTDEAVKYRFGIGLIKGSFPLTTIADAKAVHYFPFGWGIRLRPGRIIYNVSGRKAIELVLKNKNNHVLIGNNHPEEVVDYIRTKMNEVKK